MNNLMGIETDQAGNIIVATSEDVSSMSSICKLEVFNNDGNYVKSIDLIDRKPTGIRIRDNFLYLVDLKRKKLEIFSIITNE